MEMACLYAGNDGQGWLGRLHSFSPDNSRLLPATTVPDVLSINKQATPGSSSVVAPASRKREPIIDVTTTRQ